MKEPPNGSTIRSPGLDGGGRKLVSRWRLAEAEKDRRIEAEKAFYK